MSILSGEDHGLAFAPFCAWPSAIFAQKSTTTKTRLTKALGNGDPHHMKNITDMVKELGIESDKPREWSKAERLGLLSIDSCQQDKLQKCLFESVEYDDEDRSPANFEEIELSHLVGINRNDDVDSWMGLLFNLHKKRNFDIFQDRNSFINYVNSLDSNCEDLPHVLKVDNKYYIDGNGKHRLTIAKCLDLKTFPVFVSRLKNA